MKKSITCLVIFVPLFGLGIILQGSSLNPAYSYENQVSQTINQDNRYSKLEKDKEEVIPLDKTKWKWHHLDNDNISKKKSYENNAWDGSTSTPAFMTKEAPFPQFLTIDLGQKAVLKKFVKQDTEQEKFGKKFAQFFASQSPKDYEIFGSNSPSQDGSWSSWTKLGEGKFNRPEGFKSPKTEGHPTSTTIAAGKKGDIISIASEESYRYIRLKINSTYRDPQLPFTVWIGEITLYGVPVQQ